MPLPKLAVQSLDDQNFRRRHREVTNSILDHSFDDSKVRTPAEVAAGVTPINTAYDPYNVRRYGAKGDGVTDDTAAINAAILVASQTNAGAPGSAVLFPVGTYEISSTITLPNHVKLVGANKEASVIQAISTWNSTTYPFMFKADNGSSSMFDSTTEDILFDCNNIAGLSTVLSNAWQNNCGPRRALYWRFGVYGILYDDTGYTASGGADIIILEDFELFGSTVNTPTAGLLMEQISSVSNCVLHATRGVIAGSPSHILPRGIHIVKDSSIINKVHFENVTTGVYLDGSGSHVLINLSTDTNSTNLVEIASTFTGTLLMLACRRGGATNFLKDNRVGGVGTITGRDPPDYVIGTTSQAVTADNTAHAWCVFDGTTAGTNAPTAGFNVTSVTRNAAGDYSVNFSNNLRSTNATFNVMTALDTADGWWAADKGFGLGSCNFTIRRGGAFAGGKVDTTPIRVIVMGFGT